MTQRIVLVAAIADNGVIGADGGIPWHIAADFRHFRQVTDGHALVMGRATYESIGRPLPMRPNIVVSRNPVWRATGVQVADSLGEALDFASVYDGDIAVIGGASVYAEALPLADAQIITEVHLAPEGDRRYPEFDRAEWVETRREPQHSPEVDFEWVWLDRIDPVGDR